MEKRIKKWIKKILKKLQIIHWFINKLVLEYFNDIVKIICRRNVNLLLIGRRKERGRNMNNKYSKEAALKEHKRIELLAMKFKEGDKVAGEELLESVDSLIRRRIKGAGFIVTEDLMQDGRIRVIELTRKYDPNKCQGRYLGYIKIMLICYFRDLKDNEIARNKIASFVSYNESTKKYDSIGDVDSDYAKVELIDIINKLGELEKIVAKLYFIEFKTVTEISRILSMKRYKVEKETNKIAKILAEFY